MLRRVLAALLMAVVSVLSPGGPLANAGTTTVSAASFTYDLSAIARVGVHEIGTVRTDPAQLSDPQDASAWPLVGDSGASTTQRAARNATNTASGLSDDVLRLADSHLTRSGETVLGHYADDYIGLAQSRGASYFDIGDAYSGLTPTQQWAANQRVLDAAISNGDRITLATSRLNIRPGSPLASEISYLTGSTGNYQWLDDMTLVPGG